MNEERQWRVVYTHPADGTVEWGMYESDEDAENGQMWAALVWPSAWIQTRTIVATEWQG